MTLVLAATRTLLAILVASAAGWALLRFFDDGLTRLERAAWSLAVGLLAQCAIYLGWRLVDPGVGSGRIFLVDAVLVGASLISEHPRLDPSSRRSRGRLRPAVLLLALVAAAGCGLYLIQALSEPMWATDFLGIWGLKGKFIFQTPQWTERIFSDPALFWSHPEYPILVPISLAMFAVMTGGWGDQTLALLWPACQLATILALAGFIGRRISGLAGAGAAALVALCFPLYQAVNVGTAEVPFAFSLVLVGCASIDALENRSTARLARLAAASLFCVSIKQEGSLFVLLAIVMLTARLRRMPGRAWSGVGLALLLPLAVHWGLLRLASGPQGRRDFDFSLLLPGRWPEVPGRVAAVVGRFMEVDGRLSLIPLLAIAGFLLVTRRGIGHVLWPIFAGQLACYALAFSISAYGPVYGFDSAFRRLTMALFPSFLLVLCTRGFPGSSVIQTGNPPSVRPPKPEGSAT